MPSVSKGTPGMAMSTLPASSNHIMGAVPKRFCITRQLVGTRAWSAVSGFMVSPRRLNTRRMFSVTAGSRRSSPPKRSVSTALVRSSLVGPRPPVVITSCESAMHMLMAWRMSAGSSPTVSTRFSFQPSGPRVRAMKPELVSVTWPSSISSPITMIDKFISDCHSCERHLVVAAEVAVEVFEISGHCYHGGVVGGECPFGYECFQIALCAEVGHCPAHA